MSKIYENGITKDSVTGQVIQVGRSTDAIDPPSTKTPFELGTGISGYDAALAKEKANPTPVDTTGIKYNPDGSRILTGAEKEIADYYAQNKPKTAAEIAAEDEKIRQEHLVQQQQAITGINSMYDNLLGQINKDNNSRLGSTASINALSGNRGSASGAANEDATMTNNANVVKANEAERNAKISQVMNDYKTKIKDDILKATELRKTDANAWLTYKAGELDRNKANAVELRKNFIAAGMKPEELTDEVYKEIAVNAGYTIDQAKALYKSEYDAKIKAFTDAEAKSSADLLKTKAETAKLEAEAGAKSQSNILLNKGYVYISTPAERDQYKSEGKITTNIGGKEYLVPGNIKTKVITKGNNQVLIDMNTGEEIKVLGPKPSGAGSSDKNYTAVTIPGNLKNEILANIKGGADVDTMMATYPEVATTYIQSFYTKNTFDDYLK